MFLIHHKLPIGIFPIVILDTHIWLWWINQDSKMKPIWLNHIEQENTVGVSAISLFEVSWLEKHNRITLSTPLMEWFDKALNGSGIELIPITSEIAFQAANLTEHHSDPQDRIIISTSLFIILYCFLLMASFNFIQS